MRHAESISAVPYGTGPHHFRLFNSERPTAHERESRVLSVFYVGHPRDVVAPGRSTWGSAIKSILTQVAAEFDGLVSIQFKELFNLAEFRPAVHQFGFPRLLILNSELPGAAGIVRELRANPLLGSICIVMCNAVYDEQERDQWIENGADGFVELEPSVPALKTSIENIVKWIELRGASMSSVAALKASMEKLVKRIDQMEDLAGWMAPRELGKGEGEFVAPTQSISATAQQVVVEIGLDDVARPGN